jgi:hypothetical protein
VTTQMITTTATVQCASAGDLSEPLIRFRLSAADLRRVDESIERIISVLPISRLDIGGQLNAGKPLRALGAVHRGDAQSDRLAVIVVDWPTGASAKRL